MKNESIKITNEQEVLDLELRALRIINPINDTLHPVFIDGCCGIGHRLANVLPTLVYANRNRRIGKVFWPDVPWGSLFNDTDYVQANPHDPTGQNWKIAKKLGVSFKNTYPTDWHGIHYRKHTQTHTILDQYRGIEYFLDNEHMFAILLSMRESLSPLVLSYLTPIREELKRKGKSVIDDDAHHVSVCAHVREGNGEKGDWERKNRTMTDKEVILFGTLTKMKEFVESQNATSVSIYIASDNVEIRTWFRNHSPQPHEVGNEIHWNVIQPKKVMAKPQSGVWFGEHGSGTNSVLNQTMKNEAMAEATAEIFALGECDALFLPTYSSFSYAAIVLTAGRKKRVYFKNRRTDKAYEMEEINSLLPKYRNQIQHDQDDEYDEYSDDYYDDEDVDDEYQGEYDEDYDNQ
mmetsp:Transcript_19377/g.23857  ORF Transcript_19377/g.23857 Transcript_19377/m.23857 type:complete len:405 (+) Transcript_19377:1599-2813(+)